MTFWAEMKSDMKWLLPVAIAILTFGFCAPADAQTTQPVYIRPSKGQTIALYEKVPLAQTSPLPPVSPLFEMTAFSAVQIRIEAYNTSTGDPIPFRECKLLVGMTTQGSPVKTGPFTDESFDPNGAFSNYVFGAYAATYTVNRLSSYVKFFSGSLVNNIPGAPAGTDCSFSAYMTPVPLQTGMAIVTPYRTGREFDIVTVGNVGVGAAVFQTSIGLRVPYLRIQNVGTAPLICYVNDPNVNVPVSTSHYSFALAAGTADNDGKGGSIELNNISPYSGGRVQCLAIGAPSRAAVLSFTEAAP